MHYALLILQRSKALQRSAVCTGRTGLQGKATEKVNRLCPVLPRLGMRGAVSKPLAPEAG
jgi:hypothetical protein